MFLVIQSILMYLRYEVSAITRTIHENPTLFPTVTFCNINWFTTQYAYNLTQMNTQDGQIYTLPNSDKQKLAHYLDDVLLECYFNNSPCNATDFSWSFDPDYGNCYTFNSGVDSNGTKVDLKQSNIAGWNFGLQMTLYVNVYEELLNVSSDVFGLGALIRLGNNSFTSDYLDSGILLQPGLHVNMAVDREFKSMLPKPYSNCDVDNYSTTHKLTDDSYLFNLITKSQFVYSQQFCFSQCLQKHFIEKYNCTLYIFISLFNVSLCDWDIFLDILYKDSAFKDNFINDVCLPLCPLECYQNVYRTSMVSYQLIGIQYVNAILSRPNLVMDFMQRPIDSYQAEKSIVNVNIFYESLSYTSTTESPQMDIVNLMASIGGNLSLFLGVSVFSLCEMAEVAIEIYFIFRMPSK